MMKNYVCAGVGVAGGFIVSLPVGDYAYVTPSMKNYVCAGVGVAGGFIASLFGGWTEAMAF
jgi:hypothetical protein